MNFGTSHFIINSDVFRTMVKYLRWSVCKNSNNFYTLTDFGKRFILDVWRGSEYASETCLGRQSLADFFVAITRIMLENVRKK